MSLKSKPTPDDKALFREAVGPVKRLKHDKTEVSPSQPAPIPHQTLLDQQQVLADMLSDAVDLTDLETGEELLHARPGLQRQILRKLRRGQYAISGELDLHGMTVAVARAALSAFLSQCRANDVRCVRIIHGKGNNSLGRQPILKGKVNHWLKQRNDVLAFCSARQVDGGTGAIYVLLRKC